MICHCHKPLDNRFFSCGTPFCVYILRSQTTTRALLFNVLLHRALWYNYSPQTKEMPTSQIKALIWKLCISSVYVAQRVVLSLLCDKGVKCAASLYECWWPDSQFKPRVLSCRTNVNDLLNICVVWEQPFSDRRSIRLSLETFEGSEEFWKLKLKWLRWRVFSRCFFGPSPKYFVAC